MGHLGAHHLARAPVEVPASFPDPSSRQGLGDGHGNGRRLLVGFQQLQIAEDQSQNRNALGGGNGEVIADPPVLLTAARSQGLARARLKVVAKPVEGLLGDFRNR